MNMGNPDVNTYMTRLRNFIGRQSPSPGPSSNPSPSYSPVSVPSDGYAPVQEQSWNSPPQGQYAPQINLLNSGYGRDSQYILGRDVLSLQMVHVYR